MPTYLFDEVDAGVGGKAAVEIGRRLARLAQTAQVVVVTHLPQVAAFADRQLLVEKTNDGVGHPQRRHASSRARSGCASCPACWPGQEDSETARAHAEELLATARADG